MQEAITPPGMALVLQLLLALAFDTAVGMCYHASERSFGKEHEVVQYSQRVPPNYGKVAERMYDIFRLTSRREP